MKRLHTHTFMAALALCAFPVLVPAGEAPATSAASQQETERNLAEARRKLELAASEVARLSSQLGRSFNFQLGAGAGEGPPPRALLGVSIGPGADKDGAHVMEVSPGGPAAEAGIKAGDIITGVADLDLTKDSNPGRALVEKMNQLEPDQKIKVAVLRDGKKLNFDVTTRPAPRDVLIRRDVLLGRGPGNAGPRVREFNLPAPGTPADIGQFRRGGEPENLRREPERLQALQGLLRGGDMESRFDGAEFATLSERLGSYFGVKSGVLVVRAGVNSTLKLQDGDVLLAIDGREATTAQQAGRILRSYRPGEKLTLKVQRDRKTQNIDGTAPGGRRSD